MLSFGNASAAWRRTYEGRMSDPYHQNLTQILIQIEASFDDDRDDDSEEECSPEPLPDPQD